MKRFVLCLILTLIFSPTILKGQGVANDTPEILEKLFDRLAADYDDLTRLRINDSIRIIVGSYVRSDTIFNHKFTNLKHLGQITSPDSLLKIVTWNLVLKTSPGRYFCYFIRKGEPEKGNRVYSLTTAYREGQIMTDTTYTESDWYGALYYDLKPYVINDIRCWVLLGIDYGDPLVTKKIIEVLSFTSDDSILFGKKWFESGDKFIFRHVLEYASNGIITLRFTSDKSIVFDHLVPIFSSQTADRQLYGSDYSYDAYLFENGIWKLSINVDARNKEKLLL
jgi:hypothetical protein